jgi:hypothetical protein
MGFEEEREKALSELEQVRRVGPDLHARTDPGSAGRHGATGRVRLDQAQATDAVRARGRIAERGELDTDAAGELEDRLPLPGIDLLTVHEEPERHSELASR